MHLIIREESVLALDTEAGGQILAERVCHEMWVTDPGDTLPVTTAYEAVAEEDAAVEASKKALQGPPTVFDCRDCASLDLHDGLHLE